jgi:hypothetical protein
MINGFYFRVLTPYLCVDFILSGRTAENHEHICKDIRYPDRDMNLRPLEHEEKNVENKPIPVTGCGGP